MKLILSKTLNSVEELKDLAREIMELTASGSTFLLSGDLAAGKTSFVSAFCKLHNISDVSSPTYSIHNRYKFKDKTVDHFDLYRLETEEQLESAGFFDLAKEEAGYRFIEWPERVSEIENLFIKDLYRLNLLKLSETQRKAELIKIS